MKLSNHEMERRLMSLEQVLDRTDVIGYAAARNTRILREACGEYRQMRDKLVCELGEPDTDEDGNETGLSRISFSSPNFAEFVDRIGGIAEIESDVEVFRISIDEAIGKLSGTQLLELDWMFEE